jgi:hypothetical protein
MLDLSFSRPRDTDDDGLLDERGGFGRRVRLVTCGGGDVPGVGAG